MAVSCNIPNSIAGIRNMEHSGSLRSLVSVVRHNDTETNDDETNGDGDDEDEEDDDNDDKKGDDDEDDEDIGDENDYDDDDDENNIQIKTLTSYLPSNPLQPSSETSQIPPTKTLSRRAREKSQLAACLVTEKIDYPLEIRVVPGISGLALRVSGVAFSTMVATRLFQHSHKMAQYGGPAAEGAALQIM